MKLFVERFLKVIAVAAMMNAVVFCGVLKAESATSNAPDGVFEFDTTPYRYVIVDGQEDKFRADHGLDAGYTGGVNEFYAYYKLPKDLSLKAEGKFVPGNNDYEAYYQLKKKDVGYIKFDYQEFRKYYDKTGGVYYRFPNYQDVDTPVAYDDADKELALDIGHFGVEAGLTIPNYPNLIFAYEREYRDGAKSSLTWGDARNGSISRKISPSFKDIREVVDLVELKANHTIKGFEIKGEQKFEFMRIDTTRTEKLISGEGDLTPDNKIYRRQHQMPKSDVISSVIEAARWFFKDKLYTSSGYRFGQISNYEFEDMRETTQDGIPISVSNSENRYDSTANNKYQAHTWVQHLMFIPKKWLSFGAKLKEEYFWRRSESIYNYETTTVPDWRINSSQVSDARANGQLLGEAFSLRFTAIPKTALYSELELDQTKLPLSEDRVSVGMQTAASGSEDFSRGTIAFIQRGAYTLGGRVTPWTFLDLTSHFRHTWKGNDYDDLFESISTTAKSAFFDGQDIETNEYLMRLGLKTTKYFRPGFRYVLRDTVYETRVQAQPSVKTGNYSHNVIFDITSNLRDDLLATTSISRTLAKTYIDQLQNWSARTPGFRSNVNTWLLGLSYSPKKNFSFNNALHYSFAHNFDDFTTDTTSSIGLPLGADYDVVDVETSVTWKPTDRITVEPKYGLYKYTSNPNVQMASYTAHALTLELNFAWG